MKKKRNFLGIVFILPLIGLIAQTPYFYYYNGKRQYLELDTKHIFVSMADNNTTNAFVSNKMNQKSLRVDIPAKMQSKTKHKRFWIEVSIEDSLSDKAYLSKLLEIKNTGKDIITAPYFKNQHNDKIGLSNFFYVKLKSLNDTILLRKEAKKEQAIIVYQNEFMPLWYVMSVTETSKLDAMDMANRFFESGLFQYAEPDLMVNDEINCVNDQYFGQQWGLSNIGQYGGTSGVDIKACDAWQLSTGSNIIVAVLDQGIELNHPDLAANISPLSYDCENKTSPQIIYGDHGTACAGIIGAVRNNAQGIAGIAPNCTLMSISSSLDATPLSRMNRADGISWAWQNGADVISNSWGSSVQYQVIDDAIASAGSQGRSGKGCVVVFASGNNNLSTVNYPANLPNVIAVGAVDRCGVRSGRIDIVPNSCDPWCPTCKPGSTYGSALSVVAPGSNIYTTDRQGTAGYNTADGANGDYYSGFGGTSAACPYVAGVAALILAVNPNLTQFQVRQAIESSCTKLRYNFGYVYPNGTWNNEVGYGLVNAYKAILASLLSGPSEVCYSGSQFTLQNQQLPGVITWTVSAPFSIASSVNNTATVIRDGDALNDGTLQASVNGIVVGVKTISPCAAPSIAGPSGVCPGSTATYSISGNTDNLPVTWSSILLTQNNNFQGTSKIFTAPSSTGAGQVSVSLMVDNQQAVTIRKSVYIGNNSVSINGSPSIAAESSVTYNAALSCSATDVSWTLQAVNSSASETGTGSSIVVYSVKDLSLPYSNTPTY